MRARLQLPKLATTTGRSAHPARPRPAAAAAAAAAGGRPRLCRPTTSWSGSAAAAAAAAAAAGHRAAAAGDADADVDRQTRKRHGRTLIMYAAVSLALGAGVGGLFRVTMSPPALPERGSEADRRGLEMIRGRAARLAVVRELSTDPAWTSWEPYEAVVDEDDEDGRRARVADGHGAPRPVLTSGVLAGSRGLAYQRLFHQGATGELVAVVWLGAGLAGWPGVVHGGALATVLDETLGRLAMMSLAAPTAVTARLELTYKAPTHTNGFAFIRVRPVSGLDGGDGLADGDGARETGRKMWVEGDVRNEAGRLQVEARALFVVPRRAQ